MTWKTPDPYSAPGQRDFAAHSVPLPPVGYVTAPGGGPVKDPVPEFTNQDPARTRRDGRPTSMWLPLKGAAGKEIAIYDLDKSRPVLVIDGLRVTPDMGGNYTIRMADGTTQKLKVKATVPGYPTISFRGAVVYRSPKPPAATVAAYITAAVGAGMMAGGWAGALVGSLAAFAAGYGAATWLRNADKKTLPYLVLFSGGVMGAALGVLGFIVTMRLRSQ